ncbi:MAG TPA: hypothetical protein PLP63_06670 [Saprospiraceae bacterium]|nr:hypothetical protein [Saprospiraceae bacterium]
MKMNIKTDFFRKPSGEVEERHKNELIEQAYKMIGRDLLEHKITGSMHYSIEKTSYFIVWEIKIN